MIDILFTILGLCISYKENFFNVYAYFIRKIKTSRNYRKRN